MLLVQVFSYLLFLTVAAAQSGGPSSSNPATQCLGACFNTAIGGSASSGCADTTTSTGIEQCVCTDETFSSAVATCLSTSCPNDASSIAKSIVTFCQNNGGGAASGPPDAGGAGGSGGSGGDLGGVPGGNGKSGGGGANPFGGTAKLVSSGAANAAAALATIWFLAM